MPQKVIREYIEENFLFRSDTDKLADDDSLLDSGLIDSTGILELVGFLEEEFKISVEDDEFIPENLDSVNAIMSYIKQKKQVEAAE